MHYVSGILEKSFYPKWLAAYLARGGATHSRWQKVSCRLRSGFKKSTARNAKQSISQQQSHKLRARHIQPSECRRLKNYSHSTNQKTSMKVHG